MTEVIDKLNIEADRLETSFLAKLSRMGRDDLVDDYKEIFQIREVAAGFARRTSKQRVTRSVTLKQSNGDAPLPPLPAGFVLIDEIRKILPEIKLDRFRASDVFDILAERHPDVIIEDRRASVGATLNNLVPVELTKESDGQRKSWFSVVSIDVEDEEEESPPAKVEESTSSFLSDDDDIPF